jgi:hypothetical protein
MLGEFRVKNRGYNRKTPPWKALPWPITVRDGDLDFTLTSVFLGLGYDWTDRTLSVETNYNICSTRATFRVTKQGDLQTNWNAHFIRAITDSTGNWSCSRYYSGRRDGVTWNHFNRPPPPGDEAWQMTVEFSRVGGFDTNDLSRVVVFQVKPEFYRPPWIDAGEWVPKFR